MLPPPSTWIPALKREWLLYHLGDPRFRFMWDPAPEDEWVSVDCETTGLNVRSDEIISVAAVRIKGNRVLTGSRLELLVRPEKRRITAESAKVHQLREMDVAKGMEPDEAMREFMSFVGSRPLVGYYLEFDVAMINRAVFSMLGVGLPQPKIDVSSMYYEYKFRSLPPYRQQAGNIDLRFATLMNDLELPLRHAHDALNDAVMVGLAFLKLKRLLGR